MKNIIFPFLVIVLNTSLFAQITITSTDMPSVDDIIKRSVTKLNNIDAASTGENYYWDFSDLQFTSQTADTFLSIWNTNAIYVPVFNNVLDSNKASLALLQPNQPNPNPQVQITDSYDFYKKKSTNYAKTGYGAKINNVPTPVKYDIPELYYSFPLTYNHCDSSVSKFGLTVPTYGYYGKTIKRVNCVDGWGILKTPYGEFEVLRLVSIITGSDTLYSDSYGFGVRINNAKITEYKWIGKGHGLPLLQISKQNPGQYQITYIDSSRNTVGVDPLVIKTHNKTIYPNPSNGNVYVDVSSSDNYVLEIRNLQGIKVFYSNIHSNISSFDLTSIPKGIYILTFIGKTETYSDKLILQ